MRDSETHSQSQEGSERERLVERESPEVSQTSFLRSEDSDAELGFKFE